MLCIFQGFNFSCELSITGHLGPARLQYWEAAGCSHDSSLCGGSSCQEHTAVSGSITTAVHHRTYRGDSVVQVQPPRKPAETAAGTERLDCVALESSEQPGPVTIPRSEQDTPACQLYIAEWSSLWSLQRAEEADQFAGMRRRPSINRVPHTTPLYCNPVQETQDLSCEAQYCSTISRLVMA